MDSTEMMELDSDLKNLCNLDSDLKYLCTLQQKETTLEATTSNISEV